MSFFWQSYAPEALAWQWASVSIHWYGLILVLAIIAGFFYVRPYFEKHSVLSRAQVDDLFFYVIMAGLLGARLGHILFFNLAYYWDNPGDSWKIWQGGLSIQGALFFALLTLWWWTRKHKVSFWSVCDHLVPAVALGQAIGRWGNYFNQELYGRPTESVAGIYISPINRLSGYEAFDLFHPAFFYESVLNFCLFLYLRWRLKKTPRRTGQLTLFYFGGYSVIRFVMEFIRLDPTPLVMGWRLPQLISLIIFILIIFLLARYRRYWRIKAY